MTQYFSHDYDPIQYYGDKFPLDPTTRQPLEMIPNGPLLDYLRTPYQFQQLTDPALSTADCLTERREEVQRNWARLKEVAQQERSMHDQTEAAMQQAANQELLDEIEEEASDDANAEDNDEFKIGLSEEEEEEEEEENEMEEEEAGVGKRRVVDSDSDVDIEELETASSVASRSTHSARASQPDVYARRYKPNKRREHANDAVGVRACVVTLRSSQVTRTSRCSMRTTTSSWWTTRRRRNWRRSWRRTRRKRKRKKSYRFPTHRTRRSLDPGDRKANRNRRSQRRRRFRQWLRHLWTSRESHANVVCSRRSC